MFYSIRPESPVQVSQADSEVEDKSERKYYLSIDICDSSLPEHFMPYTVVGLFANQNL